MEGIVDDCMDTAFKESSDHHENILLKSAVPFHINLDISHRNGKPRHKDLKDIILILR